MEHIISNRHFEDKGADYAAARPTYPPSLADNLAEITPARRHAVDVGCGNGQLSVLLAEHFDLVTATDVSADQIANASPHEKVRYQTGSAERIALDEGSADLICAAQAAHWFDLPTFYAEARRIGRPGGTLALITYGVLNVDGPARPRFERFYWDEIHPFWPKGREHVETGYRNFDFPFTPVPLPALSIERDWTAAEFIAYCHTWSAVKYAKKAGRDDILSKFEADLFEIMDDQTRMHIEWPISIRAGRL